MRLELRILSLCASALVVPGCVIEKPDDEDAGEQGDGDGDGEQGDGDGEQGDGDGDDTSGDGEQGDGDGDGPTWHQDVAPIVVGVCAQCHRADGIAPMSLETYTAAMPYADKMAEYVETGIMPPWSAGVTSECDPPLPFRDDPSLTEQEIALLRGWAAAGAPEGDPNDPAPIPEPPDWTLQDPDVVMEMPKAITVGGTEDKYVCISLDPGHGSDVWITGVQTIPGNSRVTHHGLLAIDESGDSADKMGPDGYYPCFLPDGLGGGGFGQGGGLLAIWTPGMPPMRVPAGTGVHLAAGARVVLQLHYHPTGEGDETDQSEVAMTWVDSAPVLKTHFELLGNFPGPLGNGDGLLPGPHDQNGIEFRIPADVADHTETMRLTMPAQLPATPVWAVGTHMHYLGVDGLITVEHKNGETECLVATPDYAFDWQRIYEYDAELAAVPTIAGGDRVSIRCGYDNTLENPYVEELLEQEGLDAPVDTYLGESTLDEMCLAMLGVVSFF